MLSLRNARTTGFWRPRNSRSQRERKKREWRVLVFDAKRENPFSSWVRRCVRAWCSSILQLLVALMIRLRILYSNTNANCITRSWNVTECTRKILASTPTPTSTTPHTYCISNKRSSLPGNTESSGETCEWGGRRVGRVLETYAWRDQENVGLCSKLEEKTIIVMDGETHEDTLRSEIVKDLRQCCYQDQDRWGVESETVISVKIWGFVWN